MSAVGLFGVIAGAFTSIRARSLAFAALLGAYASGGFFVIATLSSFWIDAYAIERSVEADVESHAGSLPPKATLLLAGVCSYNGPAIVFDGDAVRLVLGKRKSSVKSASFRNRAWFARVTVFVGVGGQAW